jgi:hypothetical protein
MAELQRVVPAVSRGSVKRFLHELHGQGRVQLEERGRWSRWFAEKRPREERD